MPVGVKRGAAIGPDLPALDVLVLSAGQLAEPASIRYAIFDASDEVKLFEPEQVFPTLPAESEALNLTMGKLSTGRYAASWTVPSDEPLGRHEIRWWVELDGGETVSWASPFDVLPGVVGGGVFSAYALPSDMRAEGFASTDASDARLQIALRRATADVERYTRRTFGAKHVEARFDSPRGRTLRPGNDPVIAIESIRFIEDENPIDPERYVVYNRHISQRLRTPDDRNDPRIEWADHRRRNYDIIHRFRKEWGDSRQDLFVSGWFGYTDPDGSFAGGVPEPIRIATMMIAKRHVAGLGTDESEASKNSHLITSETTRDQSYTREKDPRAGEFTGDGDIDDILVNYVAPIFIGSPKQPGP